MRRDEQEATVVELACLTADRTRSEQKALVDVATRVQKRMARQTVSNPRHRSGEGPWPVDLVALAHDTWEPS